METRYLQDGKYLRKAQKATCSICGAQWYVRADRKAPDSCQKCRMKLNNPNPYLNGKQSDQTRTKKHRKAWAIKYKGGKCAACGGVFPGSAYDFHHIDPKRKDNNLGMILSGCIVKLKKELDKCILLCANCHRIEHNEGL